ncbi:hypothetical protein Terro_3201 [Terriglobus roseus DSM 18391]|uniref:Uncharacterized protein n=1 Tax=Terriglobus roseus (strain DSM 18391 / NRRL B-41598 / KBS 63) TaxID=926566 RepID=I3ZJK4_TERRK|nr:hypothetical protein Terro_3201 [Terriglobus roseus DSM 18391]
MRKEIKTKARGCRSPDYDYFLRFPGIPDLVGTLLWIVVCDDHMPLRIGLWKQ